MTDRGYIVAYLLLVFPVAYMIDIAPAKPAPAAIEAECMERQAERGEVIDPLVCIAQSLGK